MARREYLDGLDLPRREVAWLGIATTAVVLLAGGVVAFPRMVWDRFLWHYFWGPVYADANGATCAVRTPGDAPELLGSTTACSGADAAGRIVAYPGYTVVSEIGYAVTLVFMLVGMLFLIRRLGVGSDRRFFFALVPFMFLGGALRVVEDASDAVRAAGATAPIEYPLNTLVISPVIYFTVFAVTLAALVASVWLRDRGTVADYAPLLAVTGGLLTLVTVVYLLVLAPGLEADGAGLYPQMTGLTLGLAAAIAVALHRGVDRFVPSVTDGTGRIGLVVIFAHAVDGVANVLAADWATTLGLSFAYAPKHPVNAVIIDLTAAVLPAGVIATIGTAWPFLLVKLVAAVLVVWLFDAELFETAPRYAILLLVAIVAVGLGPGTRDMLRATFGI